MRRRTITAILSLTLAMCLLISQAGGVALATGAQDGASKYKEFITVDVFSDQANYQGIQAGWFGKLVKDKFNMELNIIAPNVAGGGDTLFQTRTAAGNLADLVITKAREGRLQDLVTAGLILDLTDYLGGAENLLEYRDAMEHTSKSLVQEEGIWCMPCEVSKRAATEPLTGTELNFGTYVRWDLYKQMGYPEMNTLEDLLPVMQQMQELCPESDSGKRVYAFSFFKDWDNDLMTAACQIPSFYGYGNLGFVFTRSDDKEGPEHAMQDDSLYMRGLRFLYQANQMGLVDPESTTQNFDTLYAKFQDGAVLYSFWPWLGKQAYNTQNHLELGKGIETANIKDFKFQHWGCYSRGNPQNALMVGVKAKDPQRLVDFMDWLYSPEGLSASTGQTMNTCGPEGLTWEMKDGRPVLTDLGVQAFIGGDADMPAEWGGGKFREGASQLNYKAISAGEINPQSGFPYDYQVWDSYAELSTNEITKDWQEHMGAKNAFEFFQDNGQVLAGAGCGYGAPADSTDIATLREQCKAIVVEYSWKAVFADNDEEFEANIEKMKSIVYGLGYEQVVAVDMENTAQQKIAREAVS